MQTHFVRPTPQLSTSSFYRLVELTELSEADLYDCRTSAYEAVVDAHRDGSQSDIDLAEANLAYLSTIVPADDDVDDFDFVD